MDADSETAKAAAQELDLEEPGKCSSTTKKEDLTGERKSSSDDTIASVEHTGEKLSKTEKDLEASEAEDLTPAPVPVPRSQRRGLFGRFALLAEVTEPKHYSRGTKWWITFIVASAAIAAPMGSAIILRKH